MVFFFFFLNEIRIIFVANFIIGFPYWPLLQTEYLYI
jgi:hypothetical protein